MALRNHGNKTQARRTDPLSVGHAYGVRPDVAFRRDSARQLFIAGKLGGARETRGGHDVNGLEARDLRKCIVGCNRDAVGVGLRWAADFKRGVIITEVLGV